MLQLRAAQRRGSLLACARPDYFEHTRLKTTRRQLARLGIGELSELVPGAGSAESARAAEIRVREEAERAPVRDERGVDVTPP